MASSCRCHRKGTLDVCYVAAFPVENTARKKCFLAASPERDAGCMFCRSVPGGKHCEEEVFSGSVTGKGRWMYVMPQRSRWETLRGRSVFWQRLLKGTPDMCSSQRSRWGNTAGKKSFLAASPEKDAGYVFCRSVPGGKHCGEEEFSASVS